MMVVEAWMELLDPTEGLLVYWFWDGGTGEVGMRTLGVAVGQGRRRP